MLVRGDAVRVASQALSPNSPVYTSANGVPLRPSSRSLCDTLPNQHLANVSREQAVLSRPSNTDKSDNYTTNTFFAIKGLGLRGSEISPPRSFHPTIGWPTREQPGQPRQTPPAKSTWRAASAASPLAVAAGSATPRRQRRLVSLCGRWPTAGDVLPF